jgi:hypothetical protein
MVLVDRSGEIDISILFGYRPSQTNPARDAVGEHLMRMVGSLKGSGINPGWASSFICP